LRAPRSFFLLWGCCLALYESPESGRIFKPFEEIERIFKLKDLKTNSGWKLHMKSLRQLLREKFILVAMVLLGALILVSTLLTWYNKQQLIETARIKAEAEQVKYLLGGIFERTLRSIDLGIRGYALTSNKQLLSPYEGAVREHPINLRKIDSLLTLQKLDTSVAKFERIKKELDNYIGVARQMMTEVTNGNQAEFLRLLNMDKGYDAWVAFSPFFSSTIAYEDRLIAKAQQDYEDAMNRNLVVQTILLVVGTIILFLIGARMRREATMRTNIFNELHENSLRYLFNPGKKDLQNDHSSIITETIGSFKKAADFISSVSTGNYQVSWAGLDTTNESSNEQTLAGHLHRMKSQLVKIREEEERRNWTNQGLTDFSVVVRKHQNSFEALCHESVRFILRYVKAQQGSLFTKAQEGDQVYLKLAACFAFDRKKFLEKRIEIGNGLVGQAYLEGVTVKLTQVPKDYVHITSGLGGSRPGCIVLVPMKHNEEVLALFELASLAELTDEEIVFIERCGEFLASALGNAQTNDQIKKLLQETQMQTEGMKAQEEEMRQNMEELSATQEEMLRKEREYIARISELEKGVAV
jgi:CHASE3 domain sensor protein